MRLFAEVHEKVAGLLRGPLPGGMLSDPEDADAPAGVLDYGQDISLGTVEQVGREKVARQDCTSLRAQELNQVGPFRRRAGSMPLALRISHTVDAATLTPSPAISPWILRYPHPGFSRASRRTRAWMFRRVAGRPVLPRMDLAAQRRPAMSRCQRRIVSGVTGSRSSWRRALGITLSRVATRSRSAQFSFGRCGCRRCRTASWWRRIKISAVFHASSCRDSRSHSAIRVIRRKTNRRHMIGDHHDRMPGEQLCWSGPWTGSPARTTWPPPSRRALASSIRDCARRLLDGPATSLDADERSSLEWVITLADQHPGDALVVAPLILRPHRLQPGQAMYLPAGVPHAYLSGMGLEIMASSDNVVRGGLTSKHVDGQALVHLLDPDASPLLEVPLVALSPHEVRWQPPVPDFALSRVVTDTMPVTLSRQPGDPVGPEVLLCLYGEVTVSSDGGSLSLRGGQSAFLCASASPAVLAGRGEVYRATVGRASVGTQGQPAETRSIAR